MIKIGDIAKDTITGFQGTITGYTEHMTGCHQMGLLPPALNGSWVEGATFDVDRLEIILPATVGKERKLTKKFQFNDEVADKVSAFKGRVIAYTWFFAGDDEVYVQPPCKTDGSMNDGKWLVVDRCVLVKAAEKKHVIKDAGFGPAHTVR